MDGASLGLAVVAAFKDVYLVAKYIRKTIRSAKHYQTEQTSILSEFKIEILHLKSFWKIFTRKDGNLVDDDILNEEWLESVKFILDQIRSVFTDYSRLAAEEDEDYQKYSPFSGKTIECPIAELPLEIEDAEPQPLPQKRRISRFISRFTDIKQVRQTGVELANALRWALFEKDKLEATLSGFVKWNQKLKELVPHLLDSGRYLESEERVNRLMEDDGDDNIFGAHLRLRRIAKDPNGQLSGKAGEQLMLPYDADEGSDMQQMIAARTATPRVVKESKYYEAANTGSSESELYPRQLASLLETAGSHGFRTLPFKGYIKEQSRYIFFFDYPPLAGDAIPQSLYDLIVSKEKLSLKLRFHIAHTISRSISAFHSDGWVHKSISSHAIKFFFDTAGACDFENPYLTEFELSRPDTGETRLIGQNSEQGGDGYIYQHPERQGSPIRFTKVHDIYSLGVVLLEIGLWEPAKDMYNDYMRAVRKREPHLESLSAATIRKNLLADASRRLEHRMGLAYKEAVVSCLSDEFKESLKQDDFAMTFQKMVVQKVDIKRLTE